jgi:hypothetical protein
MKPKKYQEADARRKAIQEIEDRWAAGRLSDEQWKIKEKQLQEKLKRVRRFNKAWDRQTVFYAESVEDWMEEVPAVWRLPLPFPHPVFSEGTSDHWESFLADQRRAAAIGNFQKTEQSASQYTEPKVDRARPK